MEQWILYLVGVLLAIAIGAGAGYLIVSYLHPFPERDSFGKRIDDIDRTLKRLEDNPLLLLKAELSDIQGRVERLEEALLEKGEIPHEETLK